MLAEARFPPTFRRVIASGAHEVTGAAINRLERLVVHEGHPVKDWVGKDAEKIADAAGIRVPRGTRLLFAEVDSTHPFIQAELLMPVIGFTRLKTVEECIAAAVQAEHGFGHTATMHSMNIERPRTSKVPLTGFAGAVSARGSAPPPQPASATATATAAGHARIGAQCRVALACAARAPLTGWCAAWAYGAIPFWVAGAVVILTASAPLTITHAIRAAEKQAAKPD